MKKRYNEELPNVDEKQIKEEKKNVKTESKWEAHCYTIHITHILV